MTSTVTEFVAILVGIAGLVAIALGNYLTAIVLLTAALIAYTLSTELDGWNHSETSELTARMTRSGWLIHFLKAMGLNAAFLSAVTLLVIGFFYFIR